MMHSFMNENRWREERGVNFLDTGAHFYEVYETRDGKYMAVGAIEPKFYSELLRGLGLEFANLPLQMDSSEWPSMKERFSSVFASKSRDEWTQIFESLDACVTPVLSPREAVDHPYNAERRVFDSEPQIQPQVFPRFSKTPGQISSPPRSPGSGTDEGLARWSIDEARRATLRAAGAFG
jgi:alpha-methylacyl-CoA racemase